MVGEVAKKEHANNSSSESDGRDILTVGGAIVDLGINFVEHGVDGTDDLTAITYVSAIEPQGTY